MHDYNSPALICVDDELWTHETAGRSGIGRMVKIFCDIKLNRLKVVYAKSI